MTLKIDPQKSFKFSLDGAYSKLLGKAEIIRDIIKSLPENEIIENKKELLSFAKSLEDILDKLETQNTKEAKELAENLQEIPNVKKLKGFEEFYRIRIGKYRVGIRYNNNEVTFIRLLPRKDIYKCFP